MRGVVIGALAVLSVLALLWISQRRLIYFPIRELPFPAAAVPSMEEVSFSTEDGLTLEAWFLRAGAVDATTVVVFNGNAGNRAHRVGLATGLAEHGFSVLLVDYRGYGGNPGGPTEEGLAADAHGAIDYLVSRDDVDPDRIVYFGESLGAGVAVGLATEKPPAALVLRSPFTSLQDMGSTHYPFLPVSLMLWDRYPNLERIPSIEVPVMVVAGSADSIVPLEQSQRLFAAANEPKRILIIEGADHNDAALNDGDQMLDDITTFLEEQVSDHG
jgi:fermentation-respiration switch protein FrsA (DUF1100 family)